MRLVVAFLVLFFGIARAVTVYEVAKERWELFKTKYNHSFTDPKDEKYRFKIYLENEATIFRHNRKYQSGEKSYDLRMNHFGHLLHHEFVQRMNGYAMKNKRNLGDGLTHIPPAHVEFPSEVDWRKHGAVTPVKDQGDCGSCWAFSSTGALEGAHFRKTGRLVSLSEQNLVDCSRDFGNEGCEGGLMDNAFRYVKANGGIDTETSYPYDGRDERCHFNPGNVGATDKGFTDVKRGNEASLKAAVATVGPVSVAIDASVPSFQFYSHGVYDEPQCNEDVLDHGVLVVGYGSDPKTGKDYWIVKNSWSEIWGEEGYIKMSRNKGNQCGIASSASYPAV